VTGLKDYYPAAESKLTNNKPFKGPPHADDAYLDSIKTALSQEGFTVCSPDGLPEWAHLAAEFKSDLDYSFRWAPTAPLMRFLTWFTTITSTWWCYWMSRHSMSVRKETWRLFMPVALVSRATADETHLVRSGHWPIRKAYAGFVGQ